MMSISESYNQALQTAAALLNCSPDEINRVAVQRGLDFTYRHDGTPNFRLRGRPDQYTREDVTNIWQYLDDDDRLHFAAREHTVDPDNIADRDKLLKLLAWQDYKSTGFRVNPYNSRRDVLDGAALERAGYRVASGSRVPVWSESELPEHDYLTVIYSGAGYTAMNEHYRYLGLYKVENE